MLLETRAIGETFGCPTDAVVEAVHPETKDDVDDLRIELSDGYAIFGQCKRSLSLPKEPDPGKEFDFENNAFAKAWDQFWQEFVSNPKEAEHNRCVLFYEEATGPVRVANAVLERWRGQNTASLVQVAQSKEETDCIGRFLKMVDALESKSTCSGTLRQQVLQHAYMRRVCLQSGDSDYLYMVKLLQDLLADPAQANFAISELHRLAHDLIKNRKGINRITTREYLRDKGILLPEGITFRNDFKKLYSFASGEVEYLKNEGVSALGIDGQEVSISRPVVQEMMRVVQTDSFLVVGEAGCGKTGCLLGMVEGLLQNGSQVWFWTAGSLPYGSPEEMARILQLEHDWALLFHEAASGKGATLVIDGLDSRRNPQELRAYRKLLAIAVGCGLRVVASVRSFDLRHNIDLQRSFPASPNKILRTFSHEDFSSINHICVGQLDDEELNEVLEEMPIVALAVETSPSLRDVIRNLFSLQLLCMVIHGGQLLQKLSSISTQAELFALYWEQKINGHPTLRVELNHALITLVQKMVEELRLQVSKPHGWSTLLENELFSSGTLQHSYRDEESVKFTHDLLFDYAAEKLFLQSRADQLTTELQRSPAWTFFLRPSLVLFFRNYWIIRRQEFWSMLTTFETAGVPFIHRLPGYLVAADQTLSTTDIAHLATDIREGDEGRELHLGMLYRIVATASFASMPNLFRHASGDWWLEFACYLSEGSHALIYVARIILSTASFYLKTISGQGRRLFNEAARNIVQFYLDTSSDFYPEIRDPFDWVCRTVDEDLLASGDTIRRALSFEALEAGGCNQAVVVSQHIRKIWGASPYLARDVYDAVFEHVIKTRSRAHTSRSQIVRLNISVHDELRLAHKQLAKEFPTFLDKYPGLGTEALIRVTRHYRDRTFPKEIEVPIKVLDSSEEGIRFQAGFSDMWEQFEDDDHPELQMLTLWGNFVAELPSGVDVAAKRSAISEALVENNELSAIWRKFLIAASKSPEQYVEDIGTLLKNGCVPFSPDTHEPALACLCAVIPHIPEKEVQELVTTIMEAEPSLLPWDTTKEFADSYRRNKICLLRSVPAVLLTEGAKEFLSKVADRDARREAVEVLEAENLSFTENSCVEPGPLDIKNSGVRVFEESLEVLQQTQNTKITTDNAKDLMRAIEITERNISDHVSQYSESQQYRIQTDIARCYANLASSNCANLLSISSLLMKLKYFLATPIEILSKEEIESFEIRPTSMTNPRAEASRGLCSLAARGDTIPCKSKRLLTKMSRDKDARVRIQLGRIMPNLLEKWPRFAWKTLERWSEEIAGDLGMRAVLSTTLTKKLIQALNHNDRSRSDRLLRSLSDRVRFAGSSPFREASGRWLGTNCLLNGAEASCNQLQEYVASVKDSYTELRQSLQMAGNVLFPLSPQSAGTAEQQQRAMMLLLSALSSAKVHLTTYWENDSTSSKPPEWVEAVSGFFDLASALVYTSAEELGRRADTHEANGAHEIASAWWEKTEPIMNQILELPFPKFLHLLIYALKQVAAYDLGRTMRWLKQITEAGSANGLTLEVAAKEATNELLSMVLHKYRESLVQDNALLQDFTSVMDEYIRVGDKETMRLAMEINEMFR